LLKLLNYVNCSLFTADNNNNNDNDKDIFIYLSIPLIDGSELHIANKCFAYFYIFILIKSNYK